MTNPVPPRAECPMCDEPLRFIDLGGMERCPECNSSFRKMAICAIVAQTAMSVEMRECYSELKKLGKEVAKLETILAALDAAHNE